MSARPARGGWIEITTAIELYGSYEGPPRKGRVD